jgi:hypothetical protein
MPVGTDDLPDVVGIVGSRGPDESRGRPTGWTDYQLVLRLMGRIQTVRRSRGRIATIVSGGAPSGVDFHARLAARNLGMCFGEHLIADPTTVDCPNDHFHEIKALWRGRDGKAPLNRHAGMERNDKLVRHCGLVLALFAPGEWTPGTSDVIRRCREYDIPVLIYHEGVWRE